MGARNYLIDGVSGTGKTAVCDELLRRGHHAIHGDRELAYQGDPVTGEPRDGFTHEHHVWDIDKVRTLSTDRRHAVSFFCGGSRNTDRFADLFDAIFVLEIDADTLFRRLARRGDDEWGGSASERELIVRLHATQAGLPRNAITVDATAPVTDVVDTILRHVG